MTTIEPTLGGVGGVVGEPKSSERIALDTHMAELRSASAYKDPVALALGFATMRIVQDEGDDEQLLDFLPIITNHGGGFFGSAAVLADCMGIETWTSGLHIPLKEEWHDALSTMARGLKGDNNHHGNAEAIRKILGYSGNDWGEDDSAPELPDEKLEWEAQLVVPHECVDEYSIVPVIITIMDFDEAPVDRADIWLRLILMSQGKMLPNSMNLDGAFRLLVTLAWTSEFGPMELEIYERERLLFKRNGRNLFAALIDKLPRMTDYVVPSGVRLANADRVRLGAHLAEGTTVMHEGFVNFNAGTLGASMVEGRISGGVVVGDGSDLGGGASIMGTLSGGGTEVIEVGERCLIGANAGIGISLGDDCTVEAGLYVTAGTKVTMPDGAVVKASSLSGVNGLLYRRDSEMGHVEAIEQSNGSNWAGLNEELHNN